MKQLVLTAKAAAEAGDFRAELKGVFARVASRDDRDERRESGDSGQSKDGRNEPEAAFSDSASAERFDGDVCHLFALHGVLEHRLKFFFGAALAELRANARGKFDGFKGKRKDVVSAKIESAGTFESVTPDDHDDFDGGGGFGLGLELRDKAAAAQVRGKGFGDQDFWGEGEDAIDGETIFCSDFVTLAREGCIHCVKRIAGEIQEKNTHRHLMRGKGKWVWKKRCNFCREG